MSYFEYLVNRPAIKIPDSLNSYLYDHVPHFSGVITDDTRITLTTSQELTPQQLAEATQWTLDYVDPPFWLALDHTDVSGLISASTNSQTPEVVHSFIATRADPSNNIVLDCFKTIIEYTVDDVSAFATWDPSVNPLTVSLDVYNESDGVTVVSTSENVNIIGEKFKAAALEGKTGKFTAWKTYQLTGMRDKFPGEADCIWQYKIGISLSNVTIRMSSLQKIYYVLTLRDYQ